MITAEDKTVDQAPAAVTARPRLMFKFSEYVDIGEHDDLKAERIACTDPDHFHAWCRLPNQFQHQDIRDKANAAKARKLRQLKDPSTDAGALAEQEMEMLNDPAFKDTIVEELIGLDWAEDYMAAQREVNFMEEETDKDGDPVVRYANIVQDQEELQRLSETQQETEEYKLLEKEIDSYNQAIEQRVKGLQSPKRAALNERDFDSLWKILLNARIQEMSTQAFLDVYNQWTWIAGTYLPEIHPSTNRPHRLMMTGVGDPMNPTPGTLSALAPEVIDEIRATFTRLNVAKQRGAAGN
jgi:hypothetical protein